MGAETERPGETGHDGGNEFSSMRNRFRDQYRIDEPEAADAIGNLPDLPFRMGASVPLVGRLEELAMHPTVKPVALVMDAINDAAMFGQKGLA